MAERPGSPKFDSWPRYQKVKTSREKNNMIKYTDDSVSMDEWDLRALFELVFSRTDRGIRVRRITEEQLEEKRKEITSTLLRRLYYGIKYRNLISKNGV